MVWIEGDLPSPLGWGDFNFSEQNKVIFMLTTLITGHTVDLTDIVSVGPIMQSSKGVQGSIHRRWLHFDIYCKYNVTLHHDDYTQEVIYEPDPSQNQVWQKQFEQLKQKRDDLIELWDKAQSNAALKLDGQ